MKNHNNLFKCTIFMAALLLLTVACGKSVADNAVTGTVVETENGFVIHSADGSVLQVDSDLSDMVGKRVKVIGTIEEGDTGKKITISKIEEITE